MKVEQVVNLDGNENSLCRQCNTGNRGKENYRMCTETFAGDILVICIIVYTIIRNEQTLILA